MNLFFIFFLWVFSAMAQEISKIEVRGQRRIEPEAILEKMTLKVGSTFDSEKIRADILSIFELGHFEDIRMEKEDNTLVVKVRERPVIMEIEFEGANEFEKKELEEAAALKTFTVLNLKKIAKAVSEIKSKYEQKGYYLSQINYRVDPIPEKVGEVKLVFEIDEKEKVQVRRIFFRGNKYFPATELKRFMVTGQAHAFSFMSGSGTYRAEGFERDLQALSYFYGNEGYIEARFGKPRVTLSQDRRFIDAVIEVVEGKQYFLGNVTFTGTDRFFNDEELRKSFEMAEGDVFSVGKLQEEILKMADKYGDEGYAFANVVPRTLIRDGTQIVDLEIDIEKGEKVYWNKILVTGNNKTHDRVVRRELPFHEQELYNATNRKKGLERIRRLGFFDNDIQFLTSSPKGSSNLLDLEIRVTEKPTGNLNVQAGWGSGAGFSFGGSIAQNNLFGRGQQISFNLNLTQASKTFNFSFTEPRVFDSAYLFGTDLYIDEQSQPVYLRKITGGALRTGRELSDYWGIYSTYRLERSQLNDEINPEIFTTPKDKDSYISSISATATFDSRDNRMDPKAGKYFSVTSEFAGLGGRVFQKYLLNTRFYKKVLWKFVYRINMDMGALADQWTDDPVPDTERFALGGIFSLRGYEPYSVGPAKYLVNLAAKQTQPEYYTIGGTKKFVINQEVEFPLIPEADIRAVVFFDIGNSWDRAKYTLPPMLRDYGWGIRWYSPLGPLRFEFGYPMDEVNGRNPGVQFNFMIAPSF